MTLPEEQLNELVNPEVQVTGIADHQQSDADSHGEYSIYIGNTLSTDLLGTSRRQ